VRALVRQGSERKLPAGCEAIPGSALDASTFAQSIAPCDTFVQLVGTPHPNPRKAAEFRSVDQASGMAGITAAAQAGVKHFVYVSVAHPAPMMKAYIEARVACEDAIRATRLNATILRPWYVLGPGHRWPYALIPFYWLLEQVPSTREGAMRLGLVTHDQMVRALERAVETPVEGVRIVDVSAIRGAEMATAAHTAAA
jgi:uncharacterized protein YbjT (DUF2867 family)